MNKINPKVFQVAIVETNILKLSDITGMSVAVCADIVRNTAEEQGISLMQAATQLLISKQSEGEKFRGRKRKKKRRRSKDAR